MLNRFKIAITCLIPVVFLLLFSIQANANVNENINISISKTDKQHISSIIDNSRNKVGEESIGKELNINIIEETLDNFYSELIKENISPEDLFKYNNIELLIYNGRVFNEDIGEVAGHAFTTKGKIVIYRGIRLPNNAHLSQTVLHEIGHFVYRYYFSEQDIDWYNAFRKIPKTWSSKNVWKKRPGEVFAEDFAHAFIEDKYLGKYRNKTDMRAMTNEEREIFKSKIIDIIKNIHNTEYKVYQKLMHDKDINNIRYVEIENLRGDIEEITKAVNFLDSIDYLTGISNSGSIYSELWEFMDNKDKKYIENLERVEGNRWDVETDGRLKDIVLSYVYRNLGNDKLKAAEEEINNIKKELIEINEKLVNDGLSRWELEIHKEFLPTS